MSSWVIKNTDGNGRGVFASSPIPAHTLVDTSPVLLFSKQEYEEHGGLPFCFLPHVLFNLLGKYTVLDHYTFKWPDGRMALTLGLGMNHILDHLKCLGLVGFKGSLFNHSESPNISYTLDPFTDSIRYSTARSIKLNEELCIVYDRLDPVDSPQNPLEAEVKDGLSAVDKNNTLENGPFLGDPNAMITDEELPFTKFKLPPEEEEIDNIRTGMLPIDNLYLSHQPEDPFHQSARGS